MKRWQMCAAILACGLSVSMSAQATETDASEPSMPEAAPLAALASPNVWERAKDPSLSHDWVVHVQVRRLITEPMALAENEVITDRDGSFREAQYARASLALNEAFRSGSHDPLLRLDLGELLALQDRHEAAADVLEHVLTDTPDVPGAHRAWLTLAFAYAHNDKPELEAKAYEKFLKDEEEESGDHTIAMLNLAEANMRLHRLPEAIAGYREVEIGAGKAPTRTSVLAVWGLAIALDRLGDARGAADQARLASQMDPEDRARLVRPVIGDMTTVFFVPPYERYWYLALGSTEDAKQSTNAHDASLYWGRAVTLWKAYLGPAEGIVHPEAWNAIAKSHLANAEKQLKITSERAKKEPKPAPPAYPFIH